MRNLHGDPEPGGILHDIAPHRMSTIVVQFPGGFDESMETQIAHREPDPCKDEQHPHHQVRQRSARAGEHRSDQAASAVRSRLGLIRPAQMARNGCSSVVEKHQCALRVGCQLRRAPRVDPDSVSSVQRIASGRRRPAGRFRFTVALPATVQHLEIAARHTPLTARPAPDGTMKIANFSDMVSVRSDKKDLFSCPAVDFLRGLLF